MVLLFDYVSTLPLLEVQIDFSEVFFFLPKSHIPAWLKSILSSSFAQKDCSSLIPNVLTVMHFQGFPFFIFICICLLIYLCFYLLFFAVS